MKTKFIHLRYHDTLLTDLEKNPTISPCGGVTIAYEIDPDKAIVNYAVAKCHHNDNFNRKVGCKKASGRLLSRSFRKSIAVPNDRQVREVLLFEFFQNELEEGRGDSTYYLY